jgi:osmoprotectant transport system substrate-binding protein/osmoprotectant transport system permease protein
MSRGGWRCGLVCAAAVCSLSQAAATPLRIGSKRFTESYVLGEIAKRKLELAGFQAEHRQGMGGTIILWGALESGAIDLYPDYTGTVAEEILKTGRTTADEMRAALLARGVGLTGPLGFNNTYALAMRRRHAVALGLERISDLARHPELRVGLTHEFMERRDGWKPLAAHYGLKMTDVRGIEHALAYAALASDAIDLMDVYSTDAKLATQDLAVLEDDRAFFPRYDAVFLYRLGLEPRALAAIRSLEGTLDEARMRRLNAEAERAKDYTQAAALYFGAGAQGAEEQSVRPLAARILRWTRRHLELVAVSLFLAILAGVPLGIRASRPGLVSQLILGVTGVLYTIPSLALLAMLVPLPFFGISARTAIFALFLYSLLPIVRNTAAGLADIPRGVRESAAALGLEPRAQLVKVFLPMASRTILAGIKTSAVMNVATATLAALIGAGGLGEPIFSGLNLNDNATILSGAIPAALLALVAQLSFEALDRLVIPRGLRLPQREP